MPFPGFTNQFTTSPISIAFPQYLGLSVGSTGTNPSPVQLYWPFQAPYQANQFSQVIQITYNDSGANAIILPDATATSNGQSSFIYNASGAAINLYGYGTTTPVTGTPLQANTSYELILTSNADQSGWKAIVFGEAVPTPATALVDTGFQTLPVGITFPINQTPPNPTLPLNGGLETSADPFNGSASGTYLKTYMHVNKYDGSGDYVQTQGDRGTILDWNAAGTLYYELMPAIAPTSPEYFGSGDGFVFSINNTPNSTGTCNIRPNGTDTIDGVYTYASPFVLLTGQSLSLISDGIGNWTTLGYGLNTIPLNFYDVTIQLAPGNQGAPSLSFYTDTVITPNNSLGFFYCTANPGSSAVPGWAAGAPNPLSGSLEIVQNNGSSPIILADFQANNTWMNGLVTLAWDGKSQISGSTFTPTLATLVNNYTFSSSTATLWPGSTFTNTTASLFGSTFSAATVGINGTTSITLESSAGFIDLIAEDTITLQSNTGNLDIVADTSLVMNVGTTANINATDTVTINSSSAGIDLLADTSVDIQSPSIQQYEISIYSIMRAYS